MAQRPIVQSQYNPKEKHPTLPQPRKINISVLKKKIPNEELRDTLAENLNKILDNDETRRIHELKYFELATIEEKHLSTLSAGAQKGHGTLGIRGVVAKEDIPAGTPIIYGAQYVNHHQWRKLKNKIAEELTASLNVTANEAQKDAQNRLVSYSWESVQFPDSQGVSRKLNLSAYGAGNMAAMINHDEKEHNMGVINIATLDEDDNPAPPIWIYYAKRDIKAGEQLLVDYGPKYKFNDTLHGEKEIPRPLAQTSAENMDLTYIPANQESGEAEINSNNIPVEQQRAAQNLVQKNIYQDLKSQQQSLVQSLGKEESELIKQA